MEAYNKKNDYFNRLGPQWDNVVGNNSERLEKLNSILDRVNLNKGSRVMDLGCGNGVLIPLIEGRIGPDGSITAVDAAEVMLQTAREKYAGFNNITYINALIEDLDLENFSYDTVLAFAVVPHVEDKAAALNRLRSFLKDHGRLYIFHLADTVSLNEFHSHLDAPVSQDIMPDRNAMESLLLEAGFKVTVYIDQPGLNFIEAVPCTM